MSLMKYENISKWLKNKFSWVFDSKQPIVIQSIIMFIITYCVFASMDSSGGEAMNFATSIALLVILYDDGLNLLIYTRHFFKRSPQPREDAPQIPPIKTLVPLNLGLKDLLATLWRVAVMLGLKDLLATLARVAVMISIILINQRFIPQTVQSLRSYLPARYDSNSMFTFLVGFEACLVYTVFQWGRKEPLKVAIKEVVHITPTLFGFLVGALGFPWGVPVFVNVLQLVMENSPDPRVDENDSQDEATSL